MHNDMRQRFNSNEFTIIGQDHCTLDLVLELCGGDRAEFELRAGTDAAGRYWKEGPS